MCIPRASKLLNAEFLQQLDNRLQLGVIARRFQRQVGKAHVHDLAAENVRYAEHLAALGFFRVDLDDHHFPST